MLRVLDGGAVAMAAWPRVARAAADFALQQQSSESESPGSSDREEKRKEINE